MHKLSALSALVALMLAPAWAADCNCDPLKPETLTARQCSLCREAEKQPPEAIVFFLKDINPRKTNRWLALPRAHGAGQHHLHDLSPEIRTALWTAAIEKAKSLWGDDWGLAYNGEKVRTQCHTHIHIGKFLPGAEMDHGFITVRRPSQIPAPPGEGLWIHPVSKGMHVHLGEQTTEFVLLR
ncbi:MAG TPA: hypothetical protein VMZ52_19040 [Bryobacteraceae bacterium]|nr:hypothetical protein [Bryobacteraceae bacterium]